MGFEVKNVLRKDLQKTLSEYEPYRLKVFSILPDVSIDEFDRLITDYTIVYEVVPDEELREKEN